MNAQFFLILILVAVGVAEDVPNSIMRNPAESLLEELDPVLSKTGVSNGGRVIEFAFANILSRRNETIETPDGDLGVSIVTD